MKRLGEIVLALSLLSSLATSAEAVTYQVVTGSNIGRALDTVNTAYNMLSAGPTWNTDATIRLSLQGATGVYTEFDVTLTAAPGAGKSYTFTLMVNGSSTAMSCAITGTATTCSYTDVVSVTAGDTITVQCVPAGTPTAANAIYSAVFIPTIDGETALGGSTLGTAMSSIGTEYGAMCSGVTNNATELNREESLATAGTMSNFYARVSAAPGAGKSWTVTVRQAVGDGAFGATVQSCVIADAATTCTDSDDFTVAAGDRLAIEWVPSGTPATAISQFGETFIPTIPGEFIFCQEPDAPSVSAVNYAGLTDGIAWNATESNTQNIVSAMLVTKISAHLGTAPDNGAGTQSYTLTYRNADGAGNVACTVSETNVSCTGSSLDTVTNSSHAGVSSTPSGTPASSLITVGFAAMIRPRKVLLVE